MVKKKLKSKRQTPKTRHKIHRKLKQEIIKQKKIDAKRERQKVKLPTDVLRTDEEIEQLKAIQKNEIKREKTHSSYENTQKPIYEELVESSDFVIQVIDARDIGSAIDLKKPSINLISKIDLVPDFIRENIQKDNRFIIWQNNPIEILKILYEFAKDKIINVCVIGQRNTGKSTFVSKINDALNENKDYINQKEIGSINIINRVGHIDTKDITLSNVLRNSIDLSLVDIEYFVGEALKRVDSIELAIFYGIADFTSVKEFLLLLGKKIGMERVKIAEIGKRFLLDISNGKLCFYKTEAGSTLDYIICVPE